ncbi:MAG TPA: hypothetical protein VM261_14055 [Kofleriaceae bacterium]|nr:hypothetical protein [Kofleriaceae bacterium]
MIERAVTIGARAFLALLAAACLVGLGWGARGVFADAFGAVATGAGVAIIAAAMLVGGTCAYLGREPARLLERIPARVFGAAVFVLALGSAVWAHESLHKGVPEVPDEMGYLHQARTFADGHLVAPSPPAPEFHYVSWGTHDDGRWYAVFPPGYGAVLAIGELFGAPGIVNPVLGALLAVVIWLLARELFGGDTAAARAAALLHLGSWFRLMNAGSFMAHPAAALFASLAVLGLWRGVIRRDGGPRAAWWAGGGGAALAYLGATRQLDAVIIAAALAPAIAWAFARRWVAPSDALPGARRWVAPARRLAMAVACAAPISAGYLAYNHALTGDAFLPPQQRYMQLKERRGDCFRLGFGPGVGECPITQNTNYGRDGFQPKHAVANTRRRLDAWTRWSFGWAPLALLPILGLVGGTCRGGGAARKRALGGAIFVATVLGYGLFFYHGVAYGSRFYYVAFPFAALLGAAACADIGALLRRLAAGGAAAGGAAAAGATHRARAHRARVVAAASGALVLGLVAVVLVAMRADRAAVEKHCGKRPALADGTLLGVLRAPELRDALVFVDSMKIPAAVTAHPAEIARNHPLVVKDLGDAANAGFARIYPDRRPVRLAGRRVAPLSYEPDAPMRHEGGALYPLERARGGFGQRVPAPHVGNLALSGGEALRFDVDGPGRFGFPVWALAADAGDMTLSLAFAHHPAGAGIAVHVDGVEVVAAHDTAAPAWALVVRDVAVRLTPGRHWVDVVVPAGRKGQVVFLDYAELRPRR